MSLLSWSRVGVCRAYRLKLSSSTVSVSSLAGNFQSELLQDRAVIEIKGPDSPDFLQGLVTNDVNHLDAAPAKGSEALLRRSLYTMFLNTGGRVLYEGIIVNAAADTYLLDCDTSLADKILKHLKMYKLRKKVQLKVLPDYETWALFDTQPSTGEKTLSSIAQEFKDLGIMQGEGTYCTSDPRVKSLGFRIFAPKSHPELCYQLREMDGPETLCNLRYRLGVPEGGAEVESGRALPLEYNVEYAHGVSFHKGCYIGQELTARTHHTGVIRKRVMPLTFTSRRENPIEPGESLVNEADKLVGKFIGGDKTHGIGMMRLDETTKASQIRLKTDPNTTFVLPVEKPFWWPKASPKKLT